MTTVKQILDTKGYTVWSIHPQEFVFAAIQQMAEKEVGALVVLEGDTLVGIISEQDYTRKVILKGRLSHETAVRDSMTPHVICTRFDQSIEECMTIVTERRIRHLPVLDSGRLIGIISIGDLVKTTSPSSSSSSSNLNTTSAARAASGCLQTLPSFPPARE